MDLTLTEQQRMLRSTVEELLQRDLPKETLVEIDRGNVSIGDRWDALASTGLLGILIPEGYGGAGGSLMDTAVVYEALGTGPVPGPHLSSGVIAALALMDGGTDAQKQEVLPAIAEGTRTVALAVTEHDYGWEERFVALPALADGDGFSLTGAKAYVQDAVGVSDLMVAARVPDGRVGLLLVDAASPGVDVRPLDGFETGFAEVRFDNVRVPASALVGAGAEDGWAILDRALVKALPIAAAYIVGGLSRVFDMCLTYSRTRHQFGQAIGRFQRVQDHVIDIVNHLDAARWTAYEAVWKQETGREDAGAAARVAIVAAKEGYYLGCNAAHDVHAGVGIVREYGLTLHTQMSRTLYHFLGGPKLHRRRLADAILA